MEQSVWLTVRGEQEYEGLERSCTELRTDGTLERTKDGFLLRYEEAGESGAVTHTRLSVAPESVTITRTGEVRAELRFAHGQVCTSVYALPFGAVPVEVETRELRWRLGAHGGLLDIRYRIVLGGQKGECALRVRVQVREA